MGLKPHLRPTSFCSFSPAHFLSSGGALCPLRLLESPAGMGLCHSQFLFQFRFCLGMKCPVAGAYGRITLQKLGLPLFSALSLHIKPPWCHHFVTVTKRKSSSDPSSARNPNWHELSSFMWGCDSEGGSFGSAQSHSAASNLLSFVVPKTREGIFLFSLRTFKV